MPERGTDISKFKQKYRERNEGDFPSELVINLKREWDLKYGENPNQQGAIYSFYEIDGKNASDVANLTNLQSVRSDGKGKGGLSLTNTMDITRAMDNLKWFPEPTVVIMKHNIVSGFTTQTDSGQSLCDLYRLARDSDRRSNFGGTVAFNRPLDSKTADALFEVQGHFVDVLAAPGYEDGVLTRVEKGRSEMRIGEFSSLDLLPRYKGDETHGLISIKEMPTGRIGIQDVYLTSIRSVSDLVLDPMVVNQHGKQVIERDPTQQEMKDLLAAWYINITGARSNGVVFVRNGVLVSMGSGQVERVGAVEQAIIKGIHKAFDREGITYDALLGITGYDQLKDNPFKGASCSSDAFFPFTDAVERIGRMGVTAVIQPYGSKHDAEIIEAANKYRIAMPATGERCFGHF